ncbi:MAG: Na+ dependent nucleoside transporter [Opitutae bacterium]|nr:Na+ dependent nucleoside transporter [Opitutae bacterium]|tara:strand:- start:1696 stop:2973 length:1278 start_codon:yes stop_codon:yes gene_type:complete
MDIFRNLFGILVFIGLCWVFSKKKRAISWRLVAGGLGLQLLFAVLLLKVPLMEEAMTACSIFFVTLTSFSSDGAKFVFGELATETIYGFGFSILPSILFFSALSSILYYLGVLQRIVYGLAWIMKRTMKLSGAECLAAAANVFVGQTEAPLLVRPYLDKMTRSEILCLMTGGFATIAGGVFAAYVSFLGGDDPASKAIFAKHLMTASLMSAPAAIVCAKILLPETKQVDSRLKLGKGDVGANVFDAAAKGTSQGLLLAFNVGAILIVFTALVAMLNYVTKDILGEWTDLNASIAEATSGDFSGLTLQYVLGFAFAPFAWLMGVAPQDITLVGQLLGEKIVLNEFFAYQHLGVFRDSDIITDERTLAVTAYALCGFANFASVGIQVAGIAILAPKQRENLATLAWKALLGGTIACLMTACVAGLLL